MTSRRRFTATAITSTFALGLACSSPSNPAASTGASACDDYFDAVEGVACGATTPPADELARVRARFDTLCGNLLGLPGNGITSASLEACAKALDASGCGTNFGVAECSFQGSLADSAPCNESSQCQSGNCVFSLVLSDAGTTTPACGSCVATVAAGQPCKSSDICAPGAACDGTGGTYTCTPVAYGDIGAACDDVAAECKTGLYCDGLTSHCTAPGAAGAACTESSACVSQLVCSSGGTAGMATTCQAASAAGAACQANGECAAGLGCAAATHQCTLITWASAGQPCGDVALCLVGGCPLQMGPSGPSPGGNCPMVIADGQACTTADPTETCDTFSRCTNGACQQPDGVACQ